MLSVKPIDPRLDNPQPNRKKPEEEKWARIFVERNLLSYLRQHKILRHKIDKIKKAGHAREVQRQDNPYGDSIGNQQEEEYGPINDWIDQSKGICRSSFRTAETLQIGETACLPSRQADCVFSDGIADQWSSRTICA